MQKWFPTHLPFRKRRLALLDALHFLNSSNEIIERLQQDKLYTPDEEDFILLKKIENEAQTLRLIALHTHHCFLLRLRGEQEPTF